jgi:hypothetical protein
MWLADILYSTDAATEADFGVIWAAGNDLYLTRDKMRLLRTCGQS